MNIRLKYVQHWVDKKTGATYCFLRRHGQRIRLPGIPGSVEFLAGYYAALKGDDPRAAVAIERTVQATFAGAIKRYIDDVLPKRVPSEATRKRQASTLRGWVKRCEIGERQLTALDVDYVKRNIKDAETPGIARTWMITVREFCKWAVDEKLLDADPTAGIVIKLPKSDGHHCIEDEQIAQFEARWAIGTRERLLFALLLYTGQRCSDVRKLGPHSIKDGLFPVKQQKTGVEVFVPVHSELQKVIAGSNVVGIKTYLATVTGKPMSQRDLNDLFAEACAAAGLPTVRDPSVAKEDRCVPHGLRYAFCRRLADIGTPPHEIAALSGHLTLKMVMKYTARYDRKQSAARAMARLEAAGRAA